MAARRLSLLMLTPLFVMTAQLVLSGQLVHYLPGYPGRLPFKLETGYISVGDSELFYYFIESQGNPKKDPIFLWLTGGPGCSSLSAIVNEIGPIEFDAYAYEGGLPKLKYYPYAWTQEAFPGEKTRAELENHFDPCTLLILTASIIFIDSPVGTGFSYSRTQAGWPSSDSKASQQAYEFLVKWLDEHPQYLALQLYVGGDSYSGIIVPLVTQMIIQGNLAGRVPELNLQGYLVASPRTDSFIDENSKVTFAHRMALISDEIYEAAKLYCNENYVDVDPTNTGCVTALDDYDKCIKDLYMSDILEPKCAFAEAARGSHETWEVRRSLQHKSDEGFVLSSPPKIPNLWCRTFSYVLANTWANDETVRDALHVRNGRVDNWKICNESLVYRMDRPSVVNVYRNLSTHNLNVLVECGDRDMVVPFVGTEKWIKLLNLTVDDHWRPWFVDGQVAGYTTNYLENGFRLVYATVKGGGNPAPEYYRRRCYKMFDRWVHYYPL